MKLLVITAIILTPLATQVLPAAELAPDARAWAVLDKDLHDGNSERRQEALAAISIMCNNDPKAIDRATAALHDKDALVRRSAALALGELKAHSAIPELTKSLDDNPEVSFAAAQALTELGDPAGRDVLVAVLAGERKDAPSMFTNAKRAARQQLRHPEGLLLMGTEDATGAFLGPAAMVIPAVKDATDLHSKGATGKAAAIAYLAKYPDEYAIQLLEWMVTDDNKYVRMQAAKELGERGNAGSVQKLEGLLDDKNNMVRDIAATSMLRILDRDGAPGEVAPGRVDKPMMSSK